MAQGAVKAIWEEAEASVLWRVPVGKYKGHRLFTVWMVNPSYVEWAANNWEFQDQRAIFEMALETLQTWDEEFEAIRYGKTCEQWENNPDEEF